MADIHEVNNNEFMIEKIKERPVNRRKLIKRTLITASLAVMFGLIACLTFLLLEPVISNFLYPEEEAEIVVFPEDEEEMKPEDMLEDEQEVVETPPPQPSQEPVNTQLDQEQVEEILESVKMDRTHYIQLHNVMTAYVEELSQFMVTVTVVEEEQDWLANSYEETNLTSGVVLARNNKDIFVLTNESSIRTADKIEVTFHNKETREAFVTGTHRTTGMAVLNIPLESIGPKEEIEKIPIVSLGSSKGSNMEGIPVVALGSPMGKMDSLAYGMITAVSQETSFADYNYNVLLTDIYGSQSAQGFLFNMYGRLIGVITPTIRNNDTRNLITAFGISDLKKMVSILTSGKQISYLGVEGISVTEKANKELQIPYGAYITDVINNSPAMLAGMQEGDIIVEMNGIEIDNYTDFEDAMYGAGPDYLSEFVIMRFSQGTYKEMIMEATLKAAE